ncbi:MAG: DUF4189 domain-containing protein [Candidatus Saccharibacteria bacterium]|nr:DUF4189 domain-containing protein [Rhodoferax sp.]
MKTTKLFVSFLLFAALGTSAFAIGAIAVGDTDPKAQDASTEQHFVATGHTSYDEAKEVALKQCLAKSLYFCQVALWYSSCGAYAKSEKNSGNAWANTAEEAKRQAVANCGKDCKIVVVQCEGGKHV